MAGRIKAGEGSLIGNAGEYYVMAEILKRGIIAALAPRNAPAFDILATKNGRTARIRVKTKTQGYREWQYSVKRDGLIFRDLAEKNDCTILVNLTTNTQDLRFYVLPTFQINKWLEEDFNKWVNSPGKNGRPHNPKNAKRTLNEGKPGLVQFIDNWQKVWE